MVSNRRKRLLFETAADIVADPSAPDAFVEVLWRIKSGFGTNYY